MYRKDLDPRYYYHPHYQHSRIINNNPNVLNKKSFPPQQQIIRNVQFGLSHDDSCIPVQASYYPPSVNIRPRKRHKSVERVNNSQDEFLRNVFQELKKDYDSKKQTKMKAERDTYYNPSELVSYGIKIKSEHKYILYLGFRIRSTAFKRFNRKVGC